MDPLLVGLGSLGGSLVTGAWNAYNASATNEFNAQQAQLNRDFQERMSSTAYQRGMADMRAAGLNPILAYQKGGASAPSGSSASGVNPPAPDLGQLGSTAVQALKIRQELANLKQTENVGIAQQHMYEANQKQAIASAREAEQRVNTGLPAEIAGQGVAKVYQDNPKARDARVGAEVVRGTIGSGGVVSQMGSAVGGLVGAVGPASAGAAASMAPDSIVGRFLRKFGY